MNKKENVTSKIAIVRSPKDHQYVCAQTHI